MSTVLRAEGIRVSRDGRAILDVPSLEIGRRELVSIIGPNGAGKSTLLRVMGLILPADRGAIFLGGQQVPFERGRTSELLAARRRVTMVFQSPSLLNRTVRENVAMGLRFRDTPAGEIQTRVDYWLDRLGILGLAARLPRGLSGGEVQRVALARALILEPDVLLLDEPTANLDWPTRSRLLGDLREILAGIDASAVLVTHEVREAPYFADRMLVMAEGAIRRQGAPVDVLQNPQDLQTAAFLGFENVLPAAVLEPEVYLGGRGVGPWLFCIRPEDVAVTPIAALPGDAGVVETPDAGSGRIRLAGIIRRVAPWGPVYRVTVELGRAPATQVTGTSAQGFVLQGLIGEGRPAALEFASAAGVLVPSSPS